MAIRLLGWGWGWGWQAGDSVLHRGLWPLSDQGLAKLEPETREMEQLWTRLRHG